MSILDTNKILNGTPEKRLIIGYNNMKNDYTESSASSYLKICEDLPFSSIFEHSRIIFSEPYYGLKFYENALFGDNCSFTKIVTEREKVNDYFNENENKMVVEQAELYKDLLTKMDVFIEDNFTVIAWANYIKESVDSELESKISGLLYEYNITNRSDETKLKLISAMKDITDNTSYLLYVPIVESVIGGVFTEEDTTNILLNDIFDENIISLSPMVVMASTLNTSKYYKESIKKMPLKSNRIIFESILGQSLNTELENIVIEKVKESLIEYSTPDCAVRNIFENAIDDAFDKNENRDIRIEKLKKSILIQESIENYLMQGYYISNSDNIIVNNMDIFSEGTTLFDALKITSGKIEELKGKLENEGVVVVEDFEEDVIEEASVQKPKAKTMANKIQFKAMDLEAKQDKIRSKMKNSGQQIRNAVTSVTRMPMNAVSDIKSQIKMLDEKDETRRRQYMSEPGFRKRAFKNLKLAILYGSAAQVKLAFVPITAILRHFSKDRDRRIRNDLVNSIETEIKVCEEKINDANAANDNSEKYRLIRIKDQLNIEKKRIRTNSKYI